mgnify:FL=1
MYSGEVIEALSSYEGILAYRLVDSGKKLKYIPNKGFDEEILDRIREDLSELGIDVSFEEVEHLNKTPGGKLPPIDI